MQNTLLNQPQTQRLQSIQSRGNQSKTYLPHLPKVFILAILGLGIIVGINSGCGSTEKLDATVAGEIQASQVVDKEGFPLRESRIEIPFNGPVEIRGNEGLTFEALVRDPMDRKEKPRKLNILKTEVQGNSLILHVDGPVSNGSVLTLNKSGALAVNGKSVDSGSVKVRGTKLISPLEATLWFKPFETSNVNLFTSSCYLNASPSLDLPPQPTDPVVVRRNLAAHFQNFVAQDKLTEKEVNALLARFDDPVQRKVFTLL